jgi:hypothetical protein
LLVDGCAVSERRTCTETNEAGGRCGQAPPRGKDLCFWHDPEQADAASEARRLGGVRRKREATIGGAYDLDDLDTIEGLRRYLEIAAHDALELGNSLPRVRALTTIVQVGAKLLETTELAEQVAEIQHVLSLRPDAPKHGWR